MHQSENNLHDGDISFHSSVYIEKPFFSFFFLNQRSLIKALLYQIWTRVLATGLMLSDIIISVEKN